VGELILAVSRDVRGSDEQMLGEFRSCRCGYETVYFLARDGISPTLSLDGDQVSGNGFRNEVDADIWSLPTGPLLPEPDVTEFLTVVMVFCKEPFADRFERFTPSVVIIFTGVIIVEQCDAFVEVGHVLAFVFFENYQAS
jgi:hypothetical protein